MPYLGQIRGGGQNAGACLSAQESRAVIRTRSLPKCDVKILALRPRALLGEVVGLGDSIQLSSEMVCSPPVRVISNWLEPVTWRRETSLEIPSGV